MLKCTTIELIAPISAPLAYENWIILGIKFSDEEKKDLIKVNGDNVGEICIMLNNYMFFWYIISVQEYTKMLWSHIKWSFQIFERNLMQVRGKLNHDVRAPLIPKTRREFWVDISVDLRQSVLYVCKSTRVKF